MQENLVTIKMTQLQILALGLFVLSTSFALGVPKAFAREENRNDRWACQAVCHVGIAHMDIKHKPIAQLDVPQSLMSSGDTPLEAWHSLELQCQIFAYSSAVMALPIDGVTATNSITSIAFPAASMAQNCLKM